MNFRPSHISFSGLSMYEECPQRYAYYYVLEAKPETVNLNFVFGNAFHKGLSYHYKGGDFQKGFRTALIDEIRRKTITKPQAREFDRMSETMFQDFNIFGRKFEAKEVEIEVVTPLKSPVTDETLSIPLKMIVDLITTNGEVVDHKTTSGGQDNFTKERYEKQLRIYSLGFRSWRKYSPTNLIIQSFLKRKTAGKTDYFEYAPDDMSESILFEEVKSTLSKILANDFKANPSPSRCKFCDYKNICPASMYKNRQGLNKNFSSSR